MMTLRNAVRLVTLVGLTLFLIIRDRGEMNAARFRLSTSLRAGDNQHVVDNDSNNSTAIPCIGAACSSSTTQDAPQQPLPKLDSFCSLVQHVRASQTPSQWWTTHLDDILKASQHPHDSSFAYRNWTMSLLASLSPEMLQQGVRSRPTGPSLERVARIIYHRMTDPDNSPPLQIAVVGGSVTRGQGCFEPVLPGTSAMGPNACAWPRRLELFINALAGMELVQVYNLAVSATNLEFGMPLVKYQLYPDELLPHGPDIIVSSYSTNEQQLHEDTSTSVKHANLERRRVQEFITASRMAAGPPCTAQEQPPLVVFVDDYLGNRQDNILSEMTYNKIVTELADWHPQAMHVSYADVVRRAIYANTAETTFTEEWPLETSGPYKGLPKVGVHFGMAGHVSIVYSFVYAMMDAATGFCDNKAFEQQVKGQDGVFSKQVLDRVKNVPPPELNPSLLLSKISDEWKENEARLRKSQSECQNEKDDKTFQTPCEFAFLAGPTATVQTVEQFDNYLEPFLVSNEGWSPVMEHGKGGAAVEKLGLVATGANASMTLRLTNIQKEVRVINLQRIKSYGDKWAGSRTRFTVQVDNPGNTTATPYTTQFEAGGYHSDENSVSYPFVYDLKDHKAVKGGNITLSMDLIGGTTFKIIGMMLCEF